MIRVGIIGGSGYTGGELIRILLNHKEVVINFVFSTTKVGMPIAHLHQDLIGNTDIAFTDLINPDVDLIFLCIGHGKSQNFLKQYSFSKTTKVIDLSTDFRSTRPDHNFIYGLPEVHKKHICQADRIANPGCFATAINLALFPLIKTQRLESIHVNAVTGATGGGARLVSSQHYSWRAQNFSSYKVLQHQHETEIIQLLSQESTPPKLHFIPNRGSFARGIHATCYTEFQGNVKDVLQVYREYYKNTPFTHISDIELHLKQVTNTNICLLHIQKVKSMLVITSILDNLLKGASGQAVQNMNLMFGFPETTGLQLKASYY